MRFPWKTRVDAISIHEPWVLQWQQKMERKRFKGDRVSSKKRKSCLLKERKKERKADREREEEIEKLPTTTCRRREQKRGRKRQRPSVKMK